MTFRLVRRGVASLDSTLEPAIDPEPSSRPIGRVVSISNRYKITLLGDDMYRGYGVYHLALAPNFDSCNRSYGGSATPKSFPWTMWDILGKLQPMFAI